MEVEIILASHLKHIHTMSDLITLKVRIMATINLLTGINVCLNNENKKSQRVRYQCFVSPMIAVAAASTVRKDRAAYARVKW